MYLNIEKKSHKHPMESSHAEIFDNETTSHNALERIPGSRLVLPAREFHLISCQKVNKTRCFLIVCLLRNGRHKNPIPFMTEEAIFSLLISTWRWSIEDLIGLEINQWDEVDRGKTKFKVTDVMAQSGGKGKFDGNYVETLHPDTANGEVTEKVVTFAKVWHGRGRSGRCYFLLLKVD